MLAPAPTRGDPLLISEMLNNLIDNALRYVPAGGTVTVSTGLDGGAPYLCVEDTGPGIPLEEREKVVERFYRIAGTEGDGSGLGLAIVKEIVDRHSGTLELSRSAVHGGTCVRVALPATLISTRR